tara:strand:- start:1103 stop:1402 length:300 start_codon:yes stop_codon:yes gene_type:complete
MFRMKKDLNNAMNADENIKNNPDMLEVRTKSGTDCKIAWAGNQRATYLKREGIQYICHQYDTKTQEYKFILIDPFVSHHFKLNGNVISPVETYIGNNEQ